MDILSGFKYTLLLCTRIFLLLFISYLFYYYSKTYNSLIILKHIEAFLPADFHLREYTKNKNICYNSFRRGPQIHPVTY